MVSRARGGPGWTLFACDIVASLSGHYCCCHFVLLADKPQMSFRKHRAAAIWPAEASTGLCSDIYCPVINTNNSAGTVCLSPFRTLHIQHVLQFLSMYDITLLINYNNQSDNLDFSANIQSFNAAFSLFHPWYFLVTLTWSCQTRITVEQLS